MFTNKQINQAVANVIQLLMRAKINSEATFPQLLKAVNKKKDLYLKTAKSNQTPLYLFDQSELEYQVTTVIKFFSKNIPQSKLFYALKANDYNKVIKTVVANGLNLEVSSGRELQKALESKAKKILFSGPGKSSSELQLAVNNFPRVTLNLDSFSELKCLNSVLTPTKKIIEIGVRTTTSLNSWNRFGIALSDLPKFYNSTLTYKNIRLIGIQHHQSQNLSPTPYINFIRKIANILQEPKNSALTRQLSYIDLGGGFVSSKTAAFYGSATTWGQLVNVLSINSGIKQQLQNSSCLIKSSTLEHYTKQIGLAIKKYLPNLKVDYYFEPGAIIAGRAMHILLKVTDKKSSGLVVVNGATNMVGLGKYHHYFTPLFNLTHPSQKMQKCTVMGNLCTISDTWTHFVYASQIEEDDYLLLPFQGAYTYSLKQNFIKTLPNVVDLSN
jgi:diaminopimelate decarboxylase